MESSDEGAERWASTATFEKAGATAAQSWLDVSSLKEDRGHPSGNAR
jgi:hypothetical protein